MRGALVLVGGVVKDLLIGDPIVTACTGLGCAKTLITCFETALKFDRRVWHTQHTGGAFDGQYFSLNYPEAFCTELEIPGHDRFVNSNPPIKDDGIPDFDDLTAANCPKENKTTAALCWLLFGWDLAHKLELVLGDCRADKSGVGVALVSVAWYAEAAVTAAAVVSTWSYGKMYEGLLDIAVGLEKKVYDVKCFCDTRFAQAERVVYKNYCLDLPLYFVSMNARVIENGRSRSEQALKDKSKWDKMKSLTFTMRMFALVDLLQVVRDHSLAVQEVWVLAWEVRVMCVGFLFTMSSIAAELDKDAEFTEDRFPFFFKHGKTVLEQGEIKGEITQQGHAEYGKEYTFKLDIDQIHRQGNRGNRAASLGDAKEGAASGIGDLAAAIAAFYKLRVVDDYPVMVLWMGECYDFQVAAVEAGQAAVAGDERRLAALKKLRHWATDVGSVDLPELPVLQAQMASLLARIRGANEAQKKKWSKGCKVMGVDGKPVLSSKIIVTDILTDAALYRGNRSYIYLLANCVLKTINEAVVESQGCCVDVHADPKRHLNAVTYAMEAFIDRNGPPLAKADRVLIEAIDAYSREHHATQGGGGWHYHTAHSSSRSKQSGISKVCEGEENKKAKFPFMC